MLSRLDRRRRRLAAVATIAYRYTSTTGGRVLVVARERGGRSSTRVRVGRARPEGFVSRPDIYGAYAGVYARGLRHSSTLHQNLLYVAVRAAAGGAAGARFRSTPTRRLRSMPVINRYSLILLAAIALVVLTLAAAVGSPSLRTCSMPSVADLDEPASAVGDGDLDARAPEHDRAAECARSQLRSSTLPSGPAWSSCSTPEPVRRRRLTSASNAY